MKFSSLIWTWSITNGMVSSKMYNKHDTRDDLNFGIVNIPFLGEDVPSSSSDNVYTLHMCDIKTL